MSYKSALEAIANMKADKDTNYSQLSALCVAIARMELAKHREQGLSKKNLLA